MQLSVVQNETCTDLLKIENITFIPYFTSRNIVSADKAAESENNFHSMDMPTSLTNGLSEAGIVGQHGPDDKYKFILDRFPRGVALLELDPKTGESWCIYANDEYCQLSNCTREELDKYGIPATGRHSPKEDHDRNTPIATLAASTFLPFSICYRVCYGEDYKWRRSSATYTKTDRGTLYMSCLIEDFTEGATVACCAELQESANLMLTSFVTALFDANCYVDENFGILDDSSKLRYLLTYNTETSLIGVSLSSFIPLTDDKDRFHKYISSCLGLAAPTIKVRMQLNGASALTDVQVYVTPTHRASSQFASPMQSDAHPVFLVGLRVVAAPEQHTTATPRPRIAKDRTVYELQSVSRDLMAALRLVKTAEPCDHTVGLPSFEWIVPLFAVSDGELMEEEVIRCMPNNTQWDMFQAARVDNYIGVGELLEYTVEGSLNFMKKNFGKRINHSVFRFYLDIVSRLSPSEGHELLYLLDESLPIGSVIGWELTLCLLTAAYKNPECYSCPNSTDWLRDRLGKSLKSSSSLDKSQRLGPMYWICLLWGAVQVKLNRQEEARATLKPVFADMQAYCMRHPESGSVRQLQAIIAHNVAVEFLRGGNVLKALEWAHKIQAIQLTTQVTLPQKCNELVLWAERVQDQFSIL